MREIHLINWTIEEAKLLKAERPQASKVDSIPSLDQILIWPGDDASGRAAEQVDIAKTAPIQSACEKAPVVHPSNDPLAVREPKAVPSSQVAVSVPLPTSADVRTEQPKSPLPTPIIKPDIPAPVDRDRMISLRWVLRDIRSKRLKWWPIHQHDLQSLIEMEFVEMRDGTAVLTDKGERAID